MSPASGERYDVQIVFRGLFLAMVRAEHIAVILPDASSPELAILQAENENNQKLSALLAALRPYREHTAVLEFPLADWDGSSSAADVIQVRKPNKEPVGLYLLKGQTMALGGLSGEAGQLPAKPKVEGGDYKALTGGLALLTRHDESGFNQLPDFGSEVDETAVKNHSAARLELRFGEVYTERRSHSHQGDRQWRQVSVLSTSLLSDTDRRRVGLPAAPPDATEAKKINLDLVVRFTLPAGDPLQIVCTAQNLVPARFVLRPSAAGRELKVWVKNRELDAILRDSDLNPDPAPAMSAEIDAFDRDHGMFLRLASRPENLTVPRDDDDIASNTNGGCGGSGGGG